MRIFVLLCGMVVCSHSAVITESNGTAETDLNGEALVELGRKTNTPLLTLLGIAIRNLHPCMMWTSWTSCEATARGYFGTRTRTRTCVSKSSTDRDNIETDIGVCEGKCPLGSNVTEHGFCLKLQLSKLKHSDAEKACEDEGGYLVNIDSEDKYQDVITELADDTPYIHIAGRRQSPSSAWEYKYGSQTPFIKWGSGDPDNGSTDLCLMYCAKDNVWYDNNCEESRPFLCEFP